MQTHGAPVFSFLTDRPNRKLLQQPLGHPGQTTPTCTSPSQELVACFSAMFNQPNMIMLRKQQVTYKGHLTTALFLLRRPRLHIRAIIKATQDKNERNCGCQEPAANEGDGDRTPRATGGTRKDRQSRQSRGTIEGAAAARLKLDGREELT